MQLCIFEDASYLNLEPLIYSRPVYDLVCGITTLKEKILRSYPRIKYSLQCRDAIALVVKQQNPDIVVNGIEDNECLFINGSLIAPPNLGKIFPLKHKPDTVYKCGEKIIAAYASGKSLEKIKGKLNCPFDNSLFDDMPAENVELKTASYIWDLINLNGEEIRNDFEIISSKLKNKKISGKVYPGVHLVNRKDIVIVEGSVIKPGAVLDASNGPVVIDKNAAVFSNAVLEGPVYAGAGSQIKSGASIHDNVSIGAVCKVGGEVEDTIFLPYSNKQHAGFIGHAYIGSWVNLGADTNCSDLKNNYGNVKAFVNGNLIDSGSQFLGLIIGDHSKSGINMMFNTGTTAGFSSNIFGAGFPDKHIPSFSWGGKESTVTYNIDKALNTAKKVMQRRNKQMTAEEESLFRNIFKLTEDERRRSGIK